MIVDDGNAERFPFAPAAKSRAASPQAFITNTKCKNGRLHIPEAETDQFKSIKSGSIYLN